MDRRPGAPGGGDTTVDKWMLGATSLDSVRFMPTATPTHLILMISSPSFCILFFNGKTPWFGPLWATQISGTPKLLQQLLRSLLHLQQLRRGVETFGAQHCLQRQRRAAPKGGAVERHGHVLGTTTGAANDDLGMVEICYEIQIDR